MTSFNYVEGRTMDEESIIADPQFVDAAQRDFRLMPTSPALALGFQPIDMTVIGLTGDNEWRTLPLRTRLEIKNNNTKPSGAIYKND